MKKIFLVLIFMLFSTSANAEGVSISSKCELKNLIGKKYSDLKNEYKVRYEFDNGILPNFFEVQTRGNKLCDALDGKTEVSMSFVEGILAQVTFNNYSVKDVLQSILEENFGTDIIKNVANKYGAKEMQRWELDDIVIAYSKTNEVQSTSANAKTESTNNWPKEILNLTSRSLSEELSKLSGKTEASTKEKAGEL